MLFDLVTNASRPSPVPRCIFLLVQTADDEVQRLQGTLMAMDQVSTRTVVLGLRSRAMFGQVAVVQPVSALEKSDHGCSGTRACSRHSQHVDSGLTSPSRPFPYHVLVCGCQCSTFFWSLDERMRLTKNILSLFARHQVMRGIRGQNAGERERLRQEHLRLDALQVWRSTPRVSLSSAIRIECPIASGGATPYYAQKSALWCLLK